MLKSISNKMLIQYGSIKTACGNTSGTRGEKHEADAENMDKL